MNWNAYQIPKPWESDVDNRETRRAARERPDDEDEIEREIARAEDAVVDGQSRWSETGSTRKG